MTTTARRARALKLTKNSSSLSARAQRGRADRGDAAKLCVGWRSWRLGGLELRVVDVATRRDAPRRRGVQQSTRSDAYAQSQRERDASRATPRTLVVIHDDEAATAAATAAADEA